MLAPVAATAAIVCSAQAIFQTEIRRILAFSSVAQVGYILLGVSMATAEGVSAGLFHLFNQALIKSALFMALGGLAFSIKATKLSDFSGVGRTAPWTMTAFAIGTFSLAGVPLTGGFLSKWRLIEAAFAAHWLWAVGGDRGLVAAGAGLCRADAGDDLLPRAGHRDASGRGGAVRRAGSVVDSGCGQRSGIGLDASLPVELSSARGAGAGTGSGGSGAMSTGETLILAALLLPLFTAAVIRAIGRAPDVRETMTLLAGIALAILCAAMLVRTGEGDAPSLVLAHPLPGLDIAFKLEPLGALFALMSRRCGRSTRSIRSATCAPSARRTRRASTCALRWR